MTLYEGCTYNVAWTGAKPNQIELALLDAGTRKAQGPVAAGIPKDITGTALDSFAWKVGSVWPGKYFIQATAADGAPATGKTAAFTIAAMPSGLSTAQAKALCAQ